MSDIGNVCLLGLGEVGSLLADDLANDASLVAWDRQFGDPASVPSQHAGKRSRLRRAASAETAVSGCQLVISAVTAAQDLDAARSILPGLEPGAWFLDLNSVSPATRRAVANVTQDAGARYVEGAIMSPIRPKGIASPVLAGGPHASAFVPLARMLGFTGMTFCAEDLGRASAIKLCRSVVVKGTESLLAESLLAARHYGVDEEVIAALDGFFSHDDLARHAIYMISRSLEHGVRRAEEMREAASTVAEAGLEYAMSEASARSQEQVAQLGQALEQQELGAMLDAMLAIRRSRDATMEKQIR